MNRKDAILSHFHVRWHSKPAGYWEVVMHGLIVIPSVFFLSHVLIVCLLSPTF